MSDAIRFNPSFHPTELLEFGAKESEIKNIFSFKFCDNWKDKALSIGTVYYVAKAALSFFTGSWMVSLIELLTAGFLSMLRKEIRDFTNLHLATGNLRGENNTFKLSNLQLQQSIASFKDEVVELRKQRKAFEKENATYSRNNTVFTTSLRTMENVMGSMVSEFKDATTQGREVNQQLIDRQARLYREQKKALVTIQSSLAKESDATLKRFERLAQDVEKMDARGVAALNQASKELQSTLELIKEKEERVRGLKEQITRMEKVVTDLEAASKKNTETADYANAAAKKVYYGVPIDWEKTAYTLAGIAAVGAFLFANKSFFLRPISTYF